MDILNAGAVNRSLTFSICEQGEQGDDGVVGLPGKSGGRGKTGVPGLPGDQGGVGPKVKGKNKWGQLLLFGCHCVDILLVMSSPII